jgi:hypothetical protein
MGVWRVSKVRGVETSILRCGKPRASTKFCHPERVPASREESKACPERRSSAVADNRSRMGTRGCFCCCLCFSHHPSRARTGLPIPYSLLPISYSLLPIPYSLSLRPHPRRSTRSGSPNISRPARSNIARNEFSYIPRSLTRPGAPGALFRHLDEQAFRFNLRKDATGNRARIFPVLMRQSARLLASGLRLIN